MIFPKSLLDWILKWAFDILGYILSSFYHFPHVWCSTLYWYPKLWTIDPLLLLSLFLTHCKPKYNIRFYIYSYPLQTYNYTPGFRPGFRPGFSNIDRGDISNISYYITIDLELQPGTSLSPQERREGKRASFKGRS